MCGIIGIEGNFTKENFFAMMKSIKHRGEDSSGFYLYSNETIIFKNNINLEEGVDYDSIFNKLNNEYFSDKNLNLALGHNLLSIFSSYDDNDLINNFQYNLQPILFNNLILIFNGEIYNFDKINRELEDLIKDLDETLKSNLNLIADPKSDSQLLAKLIYYYLQINGNLLSAVQKTIAKIHGDFSFAVFDGENLAISRDNVGVKPLFYGFNEDKTIKAFASEKKALWKIHMNDDDNFNIYDLKPGEILYNWQINDNISFLNEINDSIISSEDLVNLNISVSKEDYKNYKLRINKSYDDFKELLIKELKESIELRVKNLNKIGLIFSGGVDSTILAVLLKKIANERKLNNNFLDIYLYSVGSKNSQDIKYSQKIAKDLDLPLKIIDVDESIVKESIKDVLISIEDANIMKLGVGMTIYLATSLMKKDGIKVAISGQGADELFGGYNRYLKHFDDNTIFKAYFELANEIKYDIVNMYHVNLERDDAVAMANGVELRVPFLDENIIKLAIEIPSEYKIKDSEDILRKHILRELAKDIGVPEYIAYRPKKAAQYGSGINKILKKKVLKEFDIESFVDSLKFN